MKSTPYFTLLCAAFILVAALTSDAHAFLYYQKVSFKLNASPIFSDLLITSDIHLNSKFYLTQKLGHISAFGFLYFLLYLWIRKPNKAFVICTLFALSTEIIQLYFGRNGRLYDVGIDMIGVGLAYLVCWWREGRNSYLC
ncbi:VanZ family protein [Sporosarcina pasteurii]|uniref:Predicted integral membrane protein n=1 Tax=Sporosarcina pasteurii TaxID=1474 RepID=A0A380BE12_SPOPA|nr:VanZ family protein [Sporosarcina pasteurii]MDS9472627.1 VanZ family protein [Sporosarcina pasteurii]QBQ06171.1 VanZ family protein [Sporosarcina pasteurii]SUI99270.1 Predicted integral membrane protein [Sporosarcina pasteurii]